MSKDYPAWFGSPVLIDQIDESVEHGILFEDALRECAMWAELRSEVVQQLREYYAAQREAK